jgi:hypothetical protein
MRDKVPLIGSTGTGEGDVVRKGDSAKRHIRQERRRRAMGRLGASSKTQLSVSRAPSGVKGDIHV